MYHFFSKADCQCYIGRTSRKPLKPKHEMNTRSKILCPVLLITCPPAFYSRTINPNLSISILVCSFEEGFCLVVSQISTLLGKSFQNIPAEREGVCTEESQSSTCCVSFKSTLFYSVYLRRSYLSSSSSIKPLPSTSKTRKTFLTSSADMAVIPTRSKNFLGLKVSAAKGKKRTGGIY